MRWTLETLSTWKCIENYWISLRRRCQCQNIVRQPSHRCMHEWRYASRSTIYRDISTGTIWSSADTIGARTMWRRYRYCGKISVCPIGMELSLVSWVSSQWAAIRWLVLAVNVLVVAVRALWLVSPDQFASFFRPFQLSRFVRCSPCTCDSCYSFHFRFGLQVDHYDCHSH